jgi:hypothetical protein
VSERRELGEFNALQRGVGKMFINQQGQSVLMKSIKTPVRRISTNGLMAGGDRYVRDWLEKSARFDLIPMTSSSKSL